MKSDSGSARIPVIFSFYEVGYRLSCDEEGKYNQELGLSKLRKYAEMFGFGSKTGLEILENEPQISDEFPVVSAIGQGTNNFTTVQSGAVCHCGSHEREFV